MEREKTPYWDGMLSVPQSMKLAVGGLGLRGVRLEDPSLRAALFAFALSRALVFFIFILATHVTFVRPADEFGRGITEMQIRIRRTSLQDNLRMLAFRSDGGWYLGIARDGYEQKRYDADGPHNWAFFPLYPLLVRGAASLTGEYPLTAMGLSNLFLLLGLITLHKTVLAFGYGKLIANRTVLYTALFPASYFFSLPWTTSLFLLTTTSSFLAAKNNRWWLAGLLGALASATRYNGVFLFPALLIMYWQTAPRPRRLEPKLFGLLLAPVGLLLYMAYLYDVTGNPLAFADAQRAWGIQWGWFWRPIWGFVSSPFALSEGWNFRLLNFAVTVMTLSCGGVMLKRREWAWACYTFISALVPLSLFTLQARYVVTIFPVFALLAQAGRSPRVDQWIRAVFIALLSLMTAFYAFFFGVALI
ncbi:MAG: hypothetical protein SF339_13840 [Blastocatellia bacterium]|nr:hypothetical protein [Blastocatellia bacterium]